MIAGDVADVGESFRHLKKGPLDNMPGARSYESAEYAKARESSVASGQSGGLGPDLLTHSGGLKWVGCANNFAARA